MRGVSARGHVTQESPASSEPSSAEHFELNRVNQRDQLRPQRAGAFAGQHPQHFALFRLVAAPGRRIGTDDLAAEVWFHAKRTEARAVPRSNLPFTAKRRDGGVEWACRGRESNSPDPSHLGNRWPQSVASTLARLSWPARRSPRPTSIDHRPMEGDDVDDFTLADPFILTAAGRKPKMPLPSAFAVAGTDAAAADQSQLALLAAETERDA